MHGPTERPNRTTPLQSVWSMVLSAMMVECEHFIYLTKCMMVYHLDIKIPETTHVFKQLLSSTTSTTHSTPYRIHSQSSFVTLSGGGCAFSSSATLISQDTDTSGRDWMASSTCREASWHDYQTTAIVPSFPTWLISLTSIAPSRAVQRKSGLAAQTAISAGRQETKVTPERLAWGNLRQQTTSNTTDQ